jgi:hypothetical protein
MVRRNTESDLQGQCLLAALFVPHSSPFIFSTHREMATISGVKQLKGFLHRRHQALGARGGVWLRVYSFRKPWIQINGI